MIDAVYKDLISNILDRGYRYEDPNRKGVVRTEIPSYTFRHNFSDGFPAISLKKLAWKSVVTELIWFLKGNTNIKYLVDNGCNIWNKDAYNYYLKQCEILKLPKDQEESIENFIKLVKNPGYTNELFKFYSSDYKIGDLGKVYGHYWRNFDGVDQIAELIDNMIRKPMSSELIVSARNPSHKEVQALPCCHYGFQIVVRPLNLEERLGNNSLDNLLEEYSEEEIAEDLDYDNIPKYGFELHWKQRSVDAFLGLPFNIASYALLALILEKITGHKALAIQGDLKKVHLYDNSLEAAKELITRKCSEERVRVLYKDEFHYITDKELMGDVSINKIIDEMKPDWFILENYNPQEPLKVKMLSRD